MRLITYQNTSDAPPAPPRCSLPGRFPTETVATRAPAARWSPMGPAPSTSPNDRIQSFASYTIAASVEVLELLTAGTTATGDSGGNILISSGAGANTLIGGDGNDLYVVNDTGDIIQETSTGGQDAVSTSVSYTLADNVETVFIRGTGVTETGNAGDNLLYDLGGVNTMIGGDGNDTYVVNDTGDVIQEGAGANSGFDRIEASVSYTAADNVEVLTLRPPAPPRPAMPAAIS